MRCWIICFVAARFRSRIPLDALYKTCEVARVGQMATLRLRRKDEVGERDGENRHADEESVCDPLHLLFALSPICRRCQPSMNDRWERLVYFHVAGSLPHCSRRMGPRVAPPFDTAAMKCRASALPPC